MVRRKCLTCGNYAYSADANAPIWICPFCKSEIPISEQEPTEKNKKSSKNKKNKSKEA